MTTIVTVSQKRATCCKVFTVQFLSSKKMLLVPSRSLLLPSSIPFGLPANRHLGAPLDLEQDETPLLDALVAASSDVRAPFFFPGHKMGRGAPRRLLRALGLRRSLRHDLPELPEVTQPTSVARSIHHSVALLTPRHLRMVPQILFLSLLRSLTISSPQKGPSCELSSSQPRLSPRNGPGSLPTAAPRASSPR